MTLRLQPEDSSLLNMKALEIVAKRQANVVAALENAEGDLLSAVPWRDLTLFDFSRCKHISRTMIEAGPWTVEICHTCGEQVARECNHEKMQWFADGKVLICMTCGKDGT